MRSSIAGLVSGVSHASWFDQQQFDLTVSKWLVLNSLRHYKHLTGGEIDGAVSEVNAELTFENDERLVRVLVIMPDEVAFESCELELVVVHLSHNLWLPLLGKERKLLLKINGLAVHFLHFSSKFDCLPPRCAIIAKRKRAIP